MHEQYESKEYLEILRELVAVTHSHPELVSAIGLCNFDAKHTEEICEYLLSKDGKVGIVSNQVQVWPFFFQPGMPAALTIPRCILDGIILTTAVLAH